MRILFALLVVVAVATAAVGCNTNGGIPSETPRVFTPSPSPLPSASSPALALRAFTAGRTPGFLGSAAAVDITAGSGDTMWFTDEATPAIGRISSIGAFTEFTRGLKRGAAPLSIVSGPEGNLWFTDESGSIGRITPSGRISEFSTRPFADAIPQGLAVGADRTIWAVALGWPLDPRSRSFLLHVTLDGKISASPLPRNIEPDGSLAADASGNLWFLASRGYDVLVVKRGTDGGIGSYRTGLKVGALPCCPNLAPKHLTIGPDGSVWFNAVGATSPKMPGDLIGALGSGGLTFFTVDYRSLHYPVFPSGLTTSSGYLWFTGNDPFQLNGALSRMSVAGGQLAYPVPYSALAVAAGHDGSIWFTGYFCSGCEVPSQIVRARF